MKSPVSTVAAALDLSFRVLFKILGAFSCGHIVNKFAATQFGAACSAAEANTPSLC